MLNSDSAKLLRWRAYESLKLYLPALLSLTSVWGCSIQNQTRLQPSDLQDRGKLLVEYQSPINQDLHEIYNTLEETKFFDDLVEDLNDTYIFPQNVNVVFDECNEENAYYDSEKVEILMCYELIKKYADIFAEEYQSDYQDEIILAGNFTFLHELGHALVDLYQLPIVVKEEDLVDSFATILLLQTENEAAAIAGIEQFDVDAEEDEQYGELSFWGEHSLSIQRVYNIACLVYGSDPDAYADFVGNNFLPVERAEGCPEEYDRAVSGWQTLLADFIK